MVRFSLTRKLGLELLSRPVEIPVNGHDLSVRKRSHEHRVEVDVMKAI
jgi:hypothetical protein